MKTKRKSLGQVLQTAFRKHLFYACPCCACAAKYEDMARAVARAVRRRKGKDL